MLFYSVVKKEWQSWEDDILRQHVSRDGECWKTLIHVHLPHRSIYSCQARWRDVLNPELQRGPFSEEETRLLREGFKKHGKEWSKISAEFLPRRAVRRLANEWTMSANPDLQRGQWTEEEDKLLLRGIEQFGTQAWTKISTELIPWRGRNQIRQRYYTINPSLKKTPWTQDERDLLLRRTIVYGNRWDKVAEGLPGRSPQSCALMWTRRVDPATKNENWSSEETRLFWERTQVFDHWVVIADGLPGRNRIDCSLKFHTAVKNELRVLFGDEIKRQENENRIEWRKRVARAMCALLEKRFEVRLDTNQSLKIVTKQLWKGTEVETLNNAVSAELAKGDDVDWENVAKALPYRSAEECELKHNSSIPTRMGKWTEEEDRQLEEAVEVHGCRWASVASTMGLRSAEQCRYRWSRILQYQSQDMLHGKRLTDAEKQLIREGVDMFGKNWKAVCAALPGRTPDQCRRWWSGRTEEMTSDGIVEHGVGRWTEAEDQTLKFAVAKYLPDKIVWTEVAQMIRGRTPMKCRSRWVNSLQPNISRGRWSYEEEMNLVELVQKYRSRTKKGISIWQAVADELKTGRTSFACYLKFNYMKRTKGSRFGLFSF
ncbi:DNA binding transcription coactivator transcription factor [Apophysomyces sp. BC1034]|nr:DNA binding transcription coactivator transcription factor [Apophysomyces sp. BC1015]KAG0177940.1 DNA binding transcription coactivator transcription factor [Apophysomyces sp. BC1021]KAG0188175.1 DNA binding transcription coactivator transcription factor [Apophysomyces sp. BC1034]